jgi:DNA-directed RNA polymerase subunit RPC12/RpoP
MKKVICSKCGAVINEKDISFNNIFEKGNWECPRCKKLWLFSGGWAVLYREDLEIYIPFKEGEDLKRTISMIEKLKI